MDDTVTTWGAGGGLILGLLFGILAQRSRFCVVAALSNLWLMRDYRQLNAWLSALAVALLGTAVLESGELVAIADSGYRRPTIDWLGLTLGGLVFGYGAILAGGCATRTLIRVAEGNLGAVVTLLTFALAGMATLFGSLELLRPWLRGFATPLAGGDSALSLILGLPHWAWPLALAALCLAVVLITGRGSEYRGSIAAGAAIGLLIMAGWWVTGVLAHDDFEPLPPASLSIAGPVARDTAWLALGQPLGRGFVLALAPGILAGALFSALLSGQFRWTPPAAERVGAYLGGGLLMGIGAMLAGGCNVGQGLTGVATGSATSLLAFGAMVLGMVLGLWRVR